MDDVSEFPALRRELLTPPDIGRLEPGPRVTHKPRALLLYGETDSLDIDFGGTGGRREGADAHDEVLREDLSAPDHGTESSDPLPVKLSHF